MHISVVMKSVRPVVLAAFLALLIVAGIAIALPTSAKAAQLTERGTTINSAKVTTLVAHTKTASTAKVADTKPQYWRCTYWAWSPGYYHAGYWVPGYYHEGYWVPGHYEYGRWVPGYYHASYWIPGYYHEGYWVPGHQYCAYWIWY